MNHYAPGAVAAWLFSHCAGIRIKSPGFEKIEIHPVPGGSLTFARAEYESVRGKIVSEWRIEQKKFILTVEIPDGVEADVVLPDGTIYKGAAAGKYECNRCMHAFRFLSKCMYEHFGEKVIILIDEYDTPMLEAYTAGYWEDAIEYTRRMFHAAFKDNPYLDRGLMTGVLPYAERIGMGSTNCRRAERGGTTDITRITQESIFSDLNNPRVVTTTVEMYQTCFGFTEKEVFTALEDYDLSERKGEVKYWYDGFQFGSRKEIYNP